MEEHSNGGQAAQIVNFMAQSHLAYANRPKMSIVQPMSPCNKMSAAARPLGPDARWEGFAFLSEVLERQARASIGLPFD